MFLACNIMSSLLFGSISLAKKPFKKRPFGISGQNENLSGKMKVIKRRRKFNATILFPIDSSPLKSASVIYLFLSTHILYEEAETHNHISQSIGALLKHQLLSRGSFVTLLI